MWIMVFSTLMLAKKWCDLCAYDNSWLLISYLGLGKFDRVGIEDYLYFSIILFLPAWQAIWNALFIKSVNKFNVLINTDYTNYDWSAFISHRFDFLPIAKMVHYNLMRRYTIAMSLFLLSHLRLTKQPHNVHIR